MSDEDIYDELWEDVYDEAGETASLYWGDKPFSDRILMAEEKFDDPTEYFDTLVRKYDDPFFVGTPAAQSNLSYINAYADAVGEEDLAEKAEECAQQTYTSLRAMVGGSLTGSAIGNIAASAAEFDQFIADTAAELSPHLAEVGAAVDGELAASLTLGVTGAFGAWLVIREHAARLSQGNIEYAPATAYTEATEELEKRLDVGVERYV